MEPIKVILLCVFSSIFYGILHDQITVRVCLEYFTIGHPPIFTTDSPTLLALGWGVIASWWVGLLLGGLLTLAARIGAWPKINSSQLVRPIFRLLILMGVASAFAGGIGYVGSRVGAIWLTEPLHSRIPTQKHSVFLADLWAHSAAYAVASLGGITICIWVIHSRRKENLLKKNKP